jgi:hypothetical protein
LLGCVELSGRKLDHDPLGLTPPQGKPCSMDFKNDRPLASVLKHVNLRAGREAK